MADSEYSVNPSHSLLYSRHVELAYRNPILKLTPLGLPLIRPAAHTSRSGSIQEPLRATRISAVAGPFGPSVGETL